MSRAGEKDRNAKGHGNADGRTCDHVANATEHGAGVVQVVAHPIGNGVVIDVSDDGPGPDGDPDAIFERRSGAGHGIGLSLARSLAHAEGGRLVLAHPGSPTTFRLALRDTDPVTEPAP